MVITTIITQQRRFQCGNRWKRCQITGGCFRQPNNWRYRLCYACKDHPAVRNRLDFGGLRQRDVARRQKQDHRNTGDAGRQTSGGEQSSSTAPSSSSSAPTAPSQRQNRVCVGFRRTWIEITRSANNKAAGLAIRRCRKRLEQCRVRQAQESLVKRR